MKHLSYHTGARRAVRIIPIVMVMIMALAQTAWSAAPSQLAADKRVAVAVYEAAINKKVYDLAVTFLGPEYRQHNPTAGDGVAGLKTFIEFLKAKFPTQHGDVIQDIPDKSANANGMF